MRALRELVLILDTLLNTAPEEFTLGRLLLPR
jgi:hypothetical protein